jgi:outer membrane receptor protein involved in Fe transport
MTISISPWKFRARHGTSVSLAVSLALLTPLRAQTTSGTILGTVTDTSGAVLPRASINIRNMNTGLVRQTHADQSGRYSEPELPIGIYEVQAAYEHLQTQIKRNLQLTVATDLVLNFSLDVSAKHEVVEAKGEASPVQLTSAEIAAVVDQRALESLPLNARDIQQLAVLQPGVQANKYHNLGPEMIVSGTRPEHNRFLLNGVDLTFTQPTSPVSAAGIIMGVEAVQEFKLLASDYSVMYGEKGGGVLNTVTKSGTNAFHGSVYEYLRSDIFDARNFFDQGMTPPFNRHQFGSSLGGPVRKQKTFFFTNYERLRHRLNLSDLAIVPDLRARQGYLPDKNSLGRETFVGVAPQVLPYLALIPEPNGASRGDGSAEFFSHPLQRIDDTYATLRIDHELSMHNSISGVYTGDWSMEFTPVQNPNFADHRNYNRHIWSAENLHTFSPSFLNTTRLGINKTWYFFRTDTTVPVDRSLYFVPDPFFAPTSVGQFGAISINGLDGLGLTLTRLGVTPRWHDYLAFSLTTDFTKIGGAHSLRFGGSYKRTLDDNVIASNLSRGAFLFQSLNRFLQGQPNSFNVYVPGSQLGRDWRNDFWGIYLEDTMRLFSNLTITSGIRYDYVRGPEEANGRITNLRAGVLDSAPTVGEPYFRQPRDLFAPRIGLNWDPFHNGKTSVRAGAGIFYDVLNSWSYFALIQGNKPFGRNVTIVNPPFPNALAAIPPTSVTDFWAVDYQPKNPTKYSYNLTIQRELGQHASMSVAYVGSQGRHLPRRGNENVYYPQVLGDGRLFWPASHGPFPNPHFRLIDIARFDATSSYNAFEASLLGRLLEGLSFNLNYTFARCLDDTSTLYNVIGGGSLTLTGSTLQYIRDRRSSRGRCSFNVEHSGNLTFTYDLPSVQRRFPILLSGWQLSSITTLQSGFPFELGTGFNNSRQGIIGNGPDRPDWVSGCTANSVIIGSPNRYFDPNCFVPAAPEFLGNMGSRTLTGPGLIMSDWALLKTTHLGEHGRLEFRAEGFNLLNRPNFAVPAFTMLFNPDRTRVGSAGRIVQTITTSRQLQFAIRFVF